MKLNFAIICDTAFIDKNERLSIIQTFDEIKVRNFPTIHPRLTVVTSYSFDKSDQVGNTLEHGVKILDPEDNKVGELAITATVVDRKNNQFLSYFNGLRINTSGDYSIVVSLNGKIYATLILKISKE